MAVSVMVAIRDRFSGRILEWYVATQLLMWGLVLLWPGSSYAISPTFFTGFGVDEDTLGAIMLGLAVIRIGALIVNGAVPDITPLVRAGGAVLGCGVWYFISAKFAASGSISVWIAAWPMACFAEFINMYRAARDARVGLHRAQIKRAHGGSGS